MRVTVSIGDVYRFWWTRHRHTRRSGHHPGWRRCVGDVTGSGMIVGRRVRGARVVMGYLRVVSMRHVGYACGRRAFAMMSLDRLTR
jgi:hypothetical protein